MAESAVLNTGALFFFLKGRVDQAMLRGTEGGQLGSVNSELCEQCNDSAVISTGRSPVPSAGHALRALHVILGNP